MANKNKKQSNRQPDSWNSVAGIMHIYGNEFETDNGKPFIKYSVSIGRKDGEGDYENFYLPVRFKKGFKTLPGVGLTTIEIENAFFSFETFRNRKGKDVEQLILVITDASLVDEDEIDNFKGKKK